MAVAQVARDDPEVRLRIQALELLLERNEDQSSAPVATALADPEPAVRDRARELIEDRHPGLEQG